MDDAAIAADHWGLLTRKHWNVDGYWIWVNQRTDAHEEGNGTQKLSRAENAVT